MKKTITVNLNGRVFTIDEDAYQLLDNYLHNLRIHFRKEKDSAEIIADFESRIEELFSERMRLGYQVINIEQVEEVIIRIGKPADFSEEGEPEENKKQADFQEYREVKKKFYRNSDDKIIGGVCSGIAAYFGWETSVVRIVLTILLFVTTFWLGIFYLIAWVIFPLARTAEQKLQMCGKPITVENIGKTVSAEAEKPGINSNNGFLSGLLRFIGGFMKVCLIIIGCLVGIPLLFALIIAFIVLFSVLFGIGDSLIGFPFGATGDTAFVAASHPILATSMFIIVLIIPISALCYTIFAHLAKLKPVHTGIKFTGFFVWLVALVLLLCSGFRINEDQFYKKVRINWNDSHVIRGNGVFSERETIITSPIDYVIVKGHLVANLQIEQVAGDSTSLLISGDENLLDEITQRWEDGKLYLSTDNSANLRSKNEIVIRIQTPSLKGVKAGSVGNVFIGDTLKSDAFEIDLDGAGRLEAKYLDVNSLTVRSSGVGSITVAGIAHRADLRLDGTGKINASDLLSDSVFAQVDGVGSIRCNPVVYLKGTVDGVGKIRYKTEPKEKIIKVFGVGSIKSE